MGKKELRIGAVKGPSMQGLLFATLCALALAAMELPIDDIAKLGVAGACVILVWWMVARSIPAIMQMHSEGISAIASAHTADMAAIAKAHSEDIAILNGAYRESVADLRKLHAETTTQICDKLHDVKEATHGVQNEIKVAAQGESALLRQLIADRNK